jgi:hypothetical protein
MRAEIASSHVTGLYKRKAHSLCNSSQVETPIYRCWGSCAAVSRANEVQRFVSRRLRYEYTTVALSLSIHHPPTAVINTPPTYCRYKYTSSLLPLSIHHPPTAVINTPPSYCRYQYTSSLLPLSIHQLPTAVINTPAPYYRYQYTTHLLPLSIHQLPTAVINTPAPYCRYQYTSSLLPLSIHYFRNVVLKRAMGYQLSCQRFNNIVGGAYLKQNTRHKLQMYQLQQLLDHTYMRPTDSVIAPTYGLLTALSYLHTAY